MDRNIVFIIAFLPLLVLGAFPAFGQSESIENDTLTEGNTFSERFQWANRTTYSLHEVHFVGGYSFHSTRGFWGKIPGAKLKVWGLRYNRKLLLLDEQHIIEYVTELNFSVDYRLTSSKYDFEPGTFSGFGIAPLGFQFNWDTENLIQPFVKSSTGFMYFGNQFPDERGAKFNFTLEVGAGVEFMLANDVSLSLGYKYHHMSNGQLGFINPGVDSNIFYTGITIF